MRRLDNSGVYCIRNVVSGRVYVGSAVSISSRWYLHRSLLKRRKHHSPTLQRSWEKHGAEAFMFQIIELVEPEQLIPREQYWINALNSSDPRTGFNIAPKAGSSLGRKHPPEVIALLRLQRKGRKMPPRSPEHRAALSLSRIGNQWSKGTRKSAESKEKMRQAKLGKPMPWVAEANRRRRGIKMPPLSAEHRARLSVASKNRSLETLARMSAAAKNRKVLRQRNKLGRYV